MIGAGEGRGTGGQGAEARHNGPEATHEAAGDMEQQASEGGDQRIGGANK